MQQLSAPPVRERPGTVRAGFGAIVAGLVVALVFAAVKLADLDSYVDRELAAGAATATPGVIFSEGSIRDDVVIGLVSGLVWVALRIAVVPFAWNGRNWARVLLWVLGGLELFAGLFYVAGFAGGYGETGFTTSMRVVQLACTAVGVVLLALPPSNDWYLSRGRPAGGRTRRSSARTGW